MAASVQSHMEQLAAGFQSYAFCGAGASQPSAVAKGQLPPANPRSLPAKCHPANQHFFDHLAQLRDAAQGLGRCQQARSYVRVMQSLRRYPLPLRSAHEVGGLQGAGKVVMGIFDEVGPAVSYDDKAWKTGAKRRLLRALEPSGQSGVPASNAAETQTQVSQPTPQPLPPWAPPQPSPPVGIASGSAGPFVLQDADDDEKPLSHLVPAGPPPQGDGAAALMATPPRRRGRPPKPQEPPLQQRQQEKPKQKQRQKQQSKPQPLPQPPPRSQQTQQSPRQQHRWQRLKAGEALGSPPPSTLTPLGQAALSTDRPTKRRRPAAPQPPPEMVMVPFDASASSTALVTAGDQRPKLVLLLDHREVGAGREHSVRGQLLADLVGRLGADAVEARSLPLADMLWVWRQELPAGGCVEHIAGWAVERKTFHDLGTSMVDGRYDEQKLRLLEAPGLTGGIVYLIEGAAPLFGVRGDSSGGSAAANMRGRGFGQRFLPTPALATTASHTQLITGFHVVHTTSTAHTLVVLETLHKALEGQRGSGAIDQRRQSVPYRDFAEQTRKCSHARVIETFGRMLRMVPHCGPEATEALVDEFQTPCGLAAALHDSSDADLLVRLKARSRSGRAPVTTSVLSACRELFVARA